MTDPDSNPKRPRVSVDCIIHCTNDNEKLVSPQSVESWNTLVRAARIRKNSPILQLAEETAEGDIPEVYYHRRCRSSFTLKKSLDSLQAEASKPESIPARDTSTRAVPSTSRTYADKCIFCDKTSKYAKKPLVMCKELRADAKVRNVATKKLDSNILAIVSRDIVAAEAHFHRSCYRMYTRDAEQGDADEEEEEDEYDVAVRNSYRELFQFIRMELFLDPKVMMMTEVASILLASLESFGVDRVQDSTKKHIRRTLEQEFGESLHIIQDNNGKLLVYPDSLTIQELVRENQSLKKELKTLRMSTGDP